MLSPIWFLALAFLTNSAPKPSQGKPEPGRGAQLSTFEQIRSLGMTEPASNSVIGGLQLIGNPGFESGTEGWGAGGSAALSSPTFVAGGYEPRSGQFAVRAEATGASGEMWVWAKPVNVRGLRDIRGSAYVRTNLGNVKISLYQMNQAGNQIEWSYTERLSVKVCAWEKMSFQAKLAHGCATVMLVIAGLPKADGSHYLDLDDIKIYGSRIDHGVHSNLGYGSPIGAESQAMMGRTLGTRISRTSAPWCVIEPNPGEYNWTNMDQAVDAILGEGQTPLLVITTSPKWANGNDDHNYVPPGTGDEYWNWRRHYGEFVTKLVTRYKGRVKHWEIGNEVNIHDFWKPVPDVWQFSCWADYIYDKIVAVDPGVQIALGGLTVLNHAYVPALQISGVEFVKGMQAWDGGTLAPKMGIVSIHAYAFNYSDAPNAEPATAGSNRLRDIETFHNAAPSSRLWITEYGWQSGLTSSNVTMDESLQNRYLQETIPIIEGYDFVDMAVWFWDADRSTATQFSGCGFFREDGSLRPCGESFRDMIGWNVAP